MILVLANDDQEILRDAYAKNNPSDTFGIPYCWLKGHSYSGLLGKSENLFVTAHGNAEEIGNADNDRIALTPADLASILHGIIPGGWAGSVYLSACDSAPEYSQGLLAAMPDLRGRIYGMVGSIGIKIEPPKNAGWIVAR